MTTNNRYFKLYFCQLETLGQLETLDKILQNTHLKASEIYQGSNGLGGQNPWEEKMWAQHSAGFTSYSVCQFKSSSGSCKIENLYSS